MMANFSARSLMKPQLASKFGAMFPVARVQHEELLSGLAPNLRKKRFMRAPLTAREPYRALSLRSGFDAAPLPLLPTPRLCSSAPVVERRGAHAARTIPPASRQIAADGGCISVCKCRMPSTSPTATAGMTLHIVQRGCATPGCEIGPRNRALKREVSVEMPRNL